MEFKKSLFIVILLCTSVMAITTTTTSCFNSSTQLKNTTYDNGTQYLIYTPCNYGCQSGTCFDSSQQIGYSWLVVMAIGLIIAIAVFMIYKSESTLFKSLVFFFAILMIIVLLLTIGGLGTNIGEDIGESLLYLAYILSLIFAFLILMFIWGYVRESHQSTMDMYNK